MALPPEHLARELRSRLGLRGSIDVVSVASALNVDVAEDEFDSFDCDIWPWSHCPVHKEKPTEGSAFHDYLRQPAH